MFSEASVILFTGGVCKVGRGCTWLGRGHVWLGKGHVWLVSRHVWLGRGHVWLGRGHVWLGRGCVWLGRGACMPEAPPPPPYPTPVRLAEFCDFLYIAIIQLFASNNVAYVPIMSLIISFSFCHARVNCT